MLRLATFNLFWFPKSGVAKNARSAEDIALVARVTSRLAADAIVFEEILDPGALAAMLELVENRTYRVLEAEPAEHLGSLRVAVAVDTNVLDVLDVRTLPNDPPPDLPPDVHPRLRAPVAAQLRDKASGATFWLIGAHLKSGLPSSVDALNDTIRLHEAKTLRTWIKAHAAAGPTFLLGDFNLTAHHPSFAPLVRETSPISQLASRVALGATAGSPNAPDEETWSTLLDRVVIDHALATPVARGWVDGDALVYAFDLDPELAEPKVDGVPFFLVEQGSGYRLIPTQGAGEREVRNMYRVSDHRPLVLRVNPA